MNMNAENQLNLGIHRLFHACLMVLLWWEILVVYSPFTFQVQDAIVLHQCDDEMNELKQIKTENKTEFQLLTPLRSYHWLKHITSCVLSSLPLTRLRCAAHLFNELLLLGMFLPEV